MDFLTIDILILDSPEFQILIGKKEITSHRKTNLAAVCISYILLSYSQSIQSFTIVISMIDVSIFRYCSVVGHHNIIFTNTRKRHHLLSHNVTSSSQVHFQILTFSYMSSQACPIFFIMSETHSISPTIPIELKKKIVLH